MNAGNKFIFLLGGADLEMNTIRLLLNRQQCCYHDLHLKWDNACLSAYKDYIDRSRDDRNCRFVGIELQEDIVPPSGYIQIDHHNENAGKPSALEQLADLLGVPLNRYEQLVAANDRAYIPGMKALQASDTEISEIRRADRACQGVTEEQECLAEQAIKECLEVCNGLILVKALSPCFSPICDRLFPYEKLLVYTDDEWIYYGKQTDKLISLFQGEILHNKVFYGGGPNGYIGCKKKVYTIDEIKQFIGLIKKMAIDGNI